MPRKNSERRRLPGAYHVYNRGRRGRAAFRDNRDRAEFLTLISRMSRQYRGLVEVHSYCLMTTHFHLIVNQLEAGELERFMTSLMSAYVRYFNRRHGTAGSLFDGPYRARRLETRKAYRWAIAYVNDNHPTGPEYAYSGHAGFIDDTARPGWQHAAVSLAEFGGTRQYLDYLENRNARKRMQTAFFDLD